LATAGAKHAVVFKALGANSRVASQGRAICHILSFSKGLTCDQLGNGTCPVILLIKKSDNDGRLAKVPRFLTTEWTIEVADEQDRRAFADALARAHACISMNWPADMPTAPALKLLHLPGAGTDAVVFDALPAATTVCNVYEHEIGIAEYVLAAMLEWEIALCKLGQAIRQGRWEGSYLFGPVHGELFGKTLGIIGYGRIGKEVARRAHAFGMRIIACSRTAGPADQMVESVAPIDQLESVLHESDFVLMSLPLSDTTRNLIGPHQLAAMKPTGVIINVSRGGLIEEQALFEACRDSQIGGAVIDTWYNYPVQRGEICPPSRYPFHQLTNVIMTPHASAWTNQLATRRNRIIAENLDRLARNEPLRNVVRAASGSGKPG
jgi:phosphoglycerate dehydrogenase-like enzyme